MSCFYLNIFYNFSIIPVLAEILFMCGRNKRSPNVKKKIKKTDFLQSDPSHETNAVVLSDRKRFLWWVKISPSLSRPTPSLQPCTWKARWRRPAASVRPPNRVQNPPSPSGWGQQPRTPGRGASTSMGPGESWSGPRRAGWGTGSRTLWLSVCVDTLGFSRRWSDLFTVYDCSFVLLSKPWWRDSTATGDEKNKHL